MNVNHSYFFEIYLTKPFLTTLPPVDHCVLATNRTVAGQEKNLIVCGSHGEVASIPNLPVEETNMFRTMFSKLARFDHSSYSTNLKLIVISHEFQTSNLYSGVCVIEK